MALGSECHSEHASLEGASNIGLDGLGMIIGDESRSRTHRARNEQRREIFLIYSGHDKVQKGKKGNEKNQRLRVGI